MGFSVCFSVGLTVVSTTSFVARVVACKIVESAVVAGKSELLPEQAAVVRQIEQINEIKTIFS